MKNLTNIFLFLLCGLTLNAGTFINEAHAGADSSTSTTIATSAISHTAGNLLVIGVGWVDAGNTITITVANTAGDTWTCGTKANNSSTSSQMCYKANTAGNANDIVTVTFSTTTIFRRLIVLQYSGMATSTPLDVEAVPNIGTSTNPISNAFTTTNATDQIIAFSSVAGVVTVGSGYTLRAANVGNFAAAEDKHVTSTQIAVTAEITSDSSNPWNFHVMAFKDAAVSLSCGTLTAFSGVTGLSEALTGTNTSWTAGTPGSPTFTISGGGPTITAQTVASTTSATLTINTGSIAGAYTITDPANSTTCVLNIISAIYADNSNIVYSGRWSQTGSSTTARAISINAGTYFDVAITGTTSLVLNFKDDTQNASGYPDILYVVDGGNPVRTTLSSGSGLAITVTFPVGSQTVHKLRVWSEGVTEGSNPSFNQWTSLAGAVTFAYITVNSGATTLPIPFSPYSMEFFGDSLTASVRQLSDGGGGSVSNATFMAAHNSYASQAANLLNLRASIVGFGGQGLTQTGSGSVPIANTAFPLIYNGVTYSPTYAPNIIVINHGTNDSGASGATFRAAYTTFLATIRSARPLAYIFCLGVPSNTHAADVSTVVTTVNDPRIFYLDYTGLSLSTTDGTHYNTSGATTLGTTLANSIQTRLNALGVVLATPITKAVISF